MSPDKFTLAVGSAVFVSGLLGLVLRYFLPENHLTGGGKDMVGAVVGLLTLLSALVLGLLIWTAYGVYAGQSVAVQTLASKVLQLDLALSDYGPEATDFRAGLRRSLGKTIDEVWGADESDADFVANNFAVAIHNLRERDAAFASLHPSTEAQTQALGAARAAVGAIGEARFQMSFALASPTSVPLVTIVAAWAMFLFFGYGLMSGGRTVSVLAVAVGALAVASATYLILHLSTPYSGIFRVSSAPLEQVLAIMGKE